MKKIFAIPILFFLSFLLSIYFLMPNYSEFKDLKKEVSQKEDELEQKETEFATYEEILKKLKEHKEDFEKVDSGLPDELSFAFLLNFFQKKAAETGLILKSLSESGFSQKQKEEETSLLAKGQENYFTLYLSGTFPAFDNFLKIMESSSRMIEAEDITLKSTKDILDFYLTIKVYSY